MYVYISLKANGWVYCLPQSLSTFSIDPVFTDNWAMSSKFPRLYPLHIPQLWASALDM